MKKLIFLWVMVFDVLSVAVIPRTVDSITTCYISGIQGIEQLNQVSNVSMTEYPAEYETAYGYPLPKSFDVNILQRISNVYGTNWNNPRFFEYPGKAYIAVLKNTYIAPSCGGVVFDSERQFVQAPWYPVLSGEVLSLPVKRFKKLATLCELWSLECYHWVAETLPRLTLLLDVIRRNPDIKILVSPSIDFDMFKWLNFLGIDESQVIVADNRYLYLADELYFAKPTFIGLVSREALLRVQRIFGDVYDKKYVDNCRESVKKIRKIVIIKRTGKTRRILNYDELLVKVMDWADAHSASVVEFDFNKTMGPIEIIGIFRDANVIIGAHGAGLVNMVFSKKKPLIIELRPERDINVCFYNCAAALTCEHWFVVIPGCGCADNFMCPVDEVLKILAGTLNKA